MNLSVEISGPQGYDFQYLNSLLVALEYLEKDEVEIYIEKRKEEDAQITFIQDEIKNIIDIQVKNRSKDIDLESFADWISHFEERSSNNCLLKKLEENKHRYVVFISDARSKDDVNLFVEEGEINTELSVGFNHEYLDKIKKDIKNRYSDSKEISKTRKIFLGNYIDNIPNNSLRSILKRVKLREKYTEVYSTEKIRYYLNKRFYIPQGKTNDVIVELLDKIRHSRGTGISITTDLLYLIEKYSGKIILNRNENFILRKERELCKSILKKENVLLLTGVSFCGKTYLAKDIAQECLENGYNVARVVELYGDEGAISFFRYRGLEDRLLILEDPFGQVETKNDAINIFNELRNLIRESSADRKIIITSRKDILFDVMLKKTIYECSIDSYCWIDLTLDSSKEMVELWISYYGSSRKSRKLCDDVIMWLEKNEKATSLQLGHIANIYNAKKELEELIELQLVDIINTARIDSNDLAGNIERRGYLASKLFVLLGLICNTHKTVTLNDLAYILSNSEKKETLGSIFDNDLEDKKYNNYPRYDFDYKLNNEYKSELKYLHQHGYIKIDNLKKIIFVHPIYHFAAQLLFKKQFIDVLEQAEITELVKKILSAPSINVNLCILTVLENLYEENQNSELKRLILLGLNSIFPSVRDKVIMFFDRRINDLDEDEQERFVGTLKCGQSINNNGIVWYDGIPFYDNSKNTNFSDRDWQRNETSKEEIDLLMEKIDIEIEITSEEIWNLLNIKNSSIIMIDILERALLYDESFIRGKAIRLIFENYAFDLENVDKYLINHEHPQFIYSLFRGAISSWIKYCSESQRKILNYFKNSLNVMSVAIITKEFLENFGYEYYEDDYLEESVNWFEISEIAKIELWNVWHEIFIEFLNKFPSRYIRMNEPHMVRVTDDSLEYIKNEENVVKLSLAWFNWLDRYLQYNLPQDYGMSVVQYLMKGTRKTSDHRADIFKIMLSTEKTSFITSNINVFIDCWNDLSTKESNIVLDLYKNNRKDIKWIKAVSLNREIIPDAIQIEILGEIINDKSVTDIVDILIKKDLLEQCLNIHCGYPQPLWWNGYHHNNKKNWDAVIVEVLKRSDLNRAFDIALREVIGLLYNHDINRISNIYDVYEELLKVSAKRKLVFEKLLYVTVSQNQGNKKLWDLLFQYSIEEEREYYFSKIVEDIELVQYWRVPQKDLFELFDKSVIYGKIFPRVEVDNQIKNDVFRTLDLFKKLNDSEGSIDFQDKELDLSNLEVRKRERLKKNCELEKIKDSFLINITKLYKESHPRLSLSNKYVKIAMKEMLVTSSELEGLIENNRVRLIHITNDLRQKYNDNYELLDWVN